MSFLNDIITYIFSFVVRVCGSFSFCLVLVCLTHTCQSSFCLVAKSLELLFGGGKGLFVASF